MAVTHADPVGIIVSPALGVFSPARYYYVSYENYKMSQWPGGDPDFVTRKPIWPDPPFRLKFRVVMDCNTFVSLGPRFADTSEMRDI